MTKAELEKEKKATTTELAERKDFALNASALAELDEFKAKAGETVHGMESLDATDLKLPSIRILQPTSAEVAEGKGSAGQFLNTLTGEASDSLVVTFLTLVKGRVFFEGKFKRGARPNCVSLDGKVGTKGTSPLNKVCEECDNSKFIEGEGSPCKNTKQWIGVLMNDKTPFRFSVKSMALANTKNFTTTMKVKLPNFPFYVVQVELTTEKKSNEQGIWYDPVYTLINTNNKEDCGVFKEMLDALKDTIVEAQAKDLDTEHNDDEMLGEDAGLKGEKAF